MNIFWETEHYELVCRLGNRRVVTLSPDHIDKLRTKFDLSVNYYKGKFFLNCDNIFPVVQILRKIDINWYPGIFIKLFELFTIFLYFFKEIPPNMSLLPLRHYTIIMRLLLGESSTNDNLREKLNVSVFENWQFGQHLIFDNNNFFWA